MFSLRLKTLLNFSRARSMALDSQQLAKTPLQEYPILYHQQCEYQHEMRRNRRRMELDTLGDESKWPLAFT